MIRNVLLIVVLLQFVVVKGQVLSQKLLQQPWPAQWITMPNADGKGYGVYKFRKAFSVKDARKPFTVHVSADNRYKLYVNGKLVSMGPARGDLYHWNFETVDITPYLQEDNNILAALVWNDGPAKPEAQISYRTAFNLQSGDETNSVVNTDTSWRCMRDSSYKPMPVQVPGYYVAGPGEEVHFSKHISGWEKQDYNDGLWQKPQLLFAGLTKESALDSRGWMLVPSPLPQMLMKEQRFASLRQLQNISPVKDFPAKKVSVTIPSNTKATLLLDNAVLTNAYPALITSGGKGASVVLGYAEALYNAPEKATSIWSYRSKGNRNEVEGKVFIGKRDSIICSGASAQAYTPLWWRTFRYLQLSIQTGSEPLLIEDIYSTETAYPFTLASSVNTDNDFIAPLLQTGWRTARLCAFETYMDCPYYEQLQYIGDARIQALVTMYNTTDSHMVRNALNLMDHSRIAEGITLSRYPTDLHQQIPTFSLWYIAMLHDYWRYRPDADFIKNKLPGLRGILHFFKQYQQADGSLKDVPYWIFTDWVGGKTGWPRGVAPIGKNGESAVLDLQLAHVCDLASELESALGLKELAAEYTANATRLKATVKRKYWNSQKGLFADTETKDLYSQHTNTLAILSSTVEGSEAIAVAKKMQSDMTLAPASIYFKYYLHQALVKAGLGEDYLNWLGKWKENMDLGLTTWAEMSEVGESRSDCHAWGSSPNIELYRTVLGIDSDAPHFAAVRVEPHLGNLKKIGGTMPHPKGSITTNYEWKNNKWNIAIELPEDVGGKLIWKGKSYVLKGGKNSFLL